MARVGFKKTFAQGALDGAAIQTLFGHMQTYIANAGFNVILNTATAIDFIKAGHAAGTANDDVPHWALDLQTAPDTIITAHAVYGNDYLDVNARVNQVAFINSAYVTSPSPGCTFWFAADGLEGWWWLHSSKVDTASSTGVSRLFTVAGTTSRRYPSDTYQGLWARYGIWEPYGAWSPPYARLEDGSIDTAMSSGTWSPLGDGAATRHAGSPLPKMAVPQFPRRNYGSACILGEFNEILSLTDGYAQEEVVVPGWIAMIGNQTELAFAVPAPASFDVL